MNFSTDQKIKTPPKPNQIEVSIFGPGYGECILIHMGSDEWIVIDSCGFDGINDAAPLHYLKLIGKDFSECVKSIVASHWDDDHIRKISQVIKECPSSEVVLSGALNNKKFTTLITDAPASATIFQKTPSGLSEFQKVHSILIERNQTPIYALPDRTIWQSEIDPSKEIISLSPHDSIFEQAIKSLIEMIPEKSSSQGRINPPSPNLTSVVLWCKNDQNRVLLGADLDNEAGWILICEKSKSIDKKAAIFKVPHHGSKNGDHPRVWNDLLEGDPICLIAPWNKGSKLPKERDLQRLKGKSPHVYLTADPNLTSKYKESDGFIKRKMKEKKVKHIPMPFGLVRLRKEMNSSDWEVECFGRAFAVN